MIYNIAIYTILLLIILLDSFQMIKCKCFIEKKSVHCFGSTWKQDLLPIENDSLQKLNISKCSKSSEYSNTFDVSFIKNLSKLKLLSITECNLKQPPIVQDQITSIEIINLSQNSIDEISQFNALGMNFFKRLPNLKILDLSKNRLKDLPKIWFDCPNQLEILNLNDNQINGLDPSLSSCFTNLKQLYLRNNQFVILKRASDFKIPTKRIDNNSVGLQISKRSKKIQPQSAKNLRHSVDKDVNNQKNYVHIIPQFVSLKILDLAFNKIRSLDQIPLLRFQNLSKLSLRGNSLITSLEINSPDNKCDFGTAPFYIKDINGLVHLDLSENTELSKISACWTFGLQDLQILDISNCSINYIGDTAFEKMRTLRKVDLSNNKLNEVPKELARISNTLIDLNLSYNNISQLRSGSLIRLENLQILNLSHNQFQNFLTFSNMDSDLKLQDSLINLQSPNDSPELEEPISLLSRMRHLKDLDFSYNNLIKISALTDLPPSARNNGDMLRVNLVGNPQLSQLLHFNYEEITPTLSSFLISNPSKLNCNCLLIGFIKWVLHRNIEVTVKCSSPNHLTGQQITGRRVLDSMIANKNCDINQESKIIKPIYRLKLSSNSNQTSENALDNVPMNSNNKKQQSNKKRSTEHQKWAMIGSNLTLRCEFYSSHQRYFKPTIEWQRIKSLPFERSSYNAQPNSNQHLKTDNVDHYDSAKLYEKIEVLNSYYDLRIKSFQIGPFDEKLDLDKFGYSSNQYMLKNHTITFSGNPYKYVSYLSIQSIYIYDVGRYRCLVNELPINQFSGQTQIISKEEEIKIFTPPRFTATPRNPMSTIEGDSAEITCRATGYPLPLTSLGIIGTKHFPAAEDRRMVVYKDDSSFFITSVQKVDAGNYSCTSRNAAGTISHNFTLKVQIPATFVEKAPSKITISIGQPLIIKYKINGVPSPSIKWFKDGKKIIPNDRIYIVSNGLMFVVESSTLEDAGLYKISILNALGGSEASVSVKILDIHGVSHSGVNVYDAPSVQTPSNLRPELPKELNWMSDYWLSAIIIIVVLSIFLTSILWITIFLCFGKLIGSKKRRLLLISNSQSKSSFDKCLTSTTNFSNPRSKPTNVCHIPFSLTTSTIVPHGQSREECHEIADSEIVSESLKTCSEFYSPQISRSCFPETQSTYSINNHMFHSQPYLTTSKLDLSSCLNQSSTPRTHYKVALKNEPCDSGIDSSHIYSETLNSSDISSIYKCRHKSKHKTNNSKRKRHQIINSSESSEALKSMSEALRSISDKVDSKNNAQVIGKDYLLEQLKSKKLCNPSKNCSTPLIDPNFSLHCG